MTPRASSWCSKEVTRLRASWCSTEVTPSDPWLSHETRRRPRRHDARETTQQAWPTTITLILGAERIPDFFKQVHDPYFEGPTSYLKKLSRYLVQELSRYLIFSRHIHTLGHIHTLPIYSHTKLRVARKGDGLVQSVYILQHPVYLIP